METTGEEMAVACLEAQPRSVYGVTEQNHEKLQNIIRAATATGTCLRDVCTANLKEGRGSGHTT